MYEGLVKSLHLMLYFVRDLLFGLKMTAELNNSNHKCISKCSGENRKHKNQYSAHISTVHMYQLYPVFWMQPTSTIPSYTI